MRKHWLILLALAAAAPLHAAVFEAKTVPASDGMLIDADLDGIVDRAAAVKADGLEDREVLAGKIWKNNRKAVFEFQLPELTGEIESAKLKLSLNGKFGCHPDKEGSSGPACDLYYYLAPEADGKIELTDDSGVKLGPAIAAEPAKRSGNSPAPVTIDVTAAVRAAAAAKSAWVGFRIEAAEGAADGAAWRFRTSEFAAISGKAFHPTLTVVTK